MKLLMIDIETSPIIADVWGLWQQNVGLNQIHQSTRMICFAAQWYGERKTLFSSEWNSATFVEDAWMLLDQADVVCHFNGQRFDVPHLNREFLQMNIPPPSPYQQIDLMKVAKGKFKFPSNKLDYILGAVGLEGKVKHEGHTLWTKVLSGDAKAQKNMEIYAKRDVTALIELYEKLLPWITNHPTVGLYDDEPITYSCPNCGSGNVQRRGFSFTSVSKYQRWSCSDCGGWSRDGKRLLGASLRPVK